LSKLILFEAEDHSYDVAVDPDRVVTVESNGEEKEATITLSVSDCGDTKEVTVEATVAEVVEKLRAA